MQKPFVGVDPALRDREHIDAEWVELPIWDGSRQDKRLRMSVSDDGLALIVTGLDNMGAGGIAVYPIAGNQVRIEVTRKGER